MSERAKSGAAGYLRWRFTGGHYPERTEAAAGASALHAVARLQYASDLRRRIGPYHRSCLRPARHGQFTTRNVQPAIREAAQCGTFAASVDGDYKDPDIYGFEMMGEKGESKVTMQFAASSTRRARKSCRRIRSRKARRSWRSVWNSHFFDDESRDFGRTTDRHIADFVRAMRAGDQSQFRSRRGWPRWKQVRWPSTVSCRANLLPFLIATGWQLW